MHVAVLFENIGGYHAARLRAAVAACAERKWKFTAIQISDAQGEHPWGAAEMNFPVRTVLARNGGNAALTAAELRESGPLVAALLDDLRPTAVALPGWGFPYSRSALAWCRRNRVPAVLMSESKFDDGKRFWLREFLKARIARKFQAALVGAQSHADYLIRLGMSPEKIFRGYDVVDNAHFARAAGVAREHPDAARARQPMIPASPYFLAVTRLIPRKNIARLLEAFATYRSRVRGPDVWDLAVCGSGAEEPRLRDFLRARELEGCVHFPGFLTYAQMGDWYGLAGAFIHPALQEQWGLVVNEAMASGIPALVSDRCGCFPELVREGVTGFGFDPTDREQITRLMLRCAGGGIDPGAMGRAAVEQMKHFTPQHFADGLIRSVKAAGARA